jgi:hypothetical protein
MAGASFITLNIGENVERPSAEGRGQSPRRLRPLAKRIEVRGQRAEDRAN